MNLSRLKKPKTFTLTEDEIVELSEVKKEGVWYSWSDLKGYLHIK